MTIQTKHWKQSKILLFIGIGVLFLTGFIGSTGQAATVEVKVVDFEFVPATVTIQPGDTVTWEWEADGHTTTSGTNCTSDGMWDSGVQNDSFTFSQTFDTAGTYPYFCTPHCAQGMTGTIVVSDDTPPPSDGITMNIDPASVSFTDVAPGDTDELTVTITNDAASTEALTGTVAGLSEPFSVTGGEGDFVLQPGESLPLTVQYAPTATGSSSATLEITHNAANQTSPLTVTIDGTTSDGGGAAALDNPFPKTIKEGGPRVALVPVATGLTAPNWAITAPGSATRLFVVDQIGTLWAVDLATGTATVFADLSSLLVPLGIAGPGTYDERGFLGLAFHPDYRTNGLLYTYTSEPVSGEADFSTMPDGTAADHQSVIREWSVPEPRQAASVVDPASSRVVLRIDQPQFNHNGGALNFGRDRMLYIALGDGGSADDEGPGHSEQGNGQDKSNVLGDILRIDPTKTTSVNGQYGIPMNNPFLPKGMEASGGQEGCADGTCDEIYASGFRNPFRFSFDLRRGHLYAADVGENHIEEVNIVRAGKNFGWRIKEGPFCFDTNGAEPGFIIDSRDCGPTGMIRPIARYDHDEGSAIVGGFVYRGSAMPAFQGRYIFGDYTRPSQNGTDPVEPGGRLFFLRQKNIMRNNTDRLSRIREMRFYGQDNLGLYVLGFGQDGSGEIYVLGNTTGTPSGQTGVVWKLGPAPKNRPSQPGPTQSGASDQTL